MYENDRRWIEVTQRDLWRTELNWMRRMLLIYRFANLALTAAVISLLLRG